MKRRIGTVLIIVGAAAVLAAAALFAWNQWQNKRAGEEAAKIADQLYEKTEADESASPYDELPIVYIDGYPYIGYLTIPDLDLELPVMAEWSYEGLRISPCRYTGSVLTDDMVICAHNYERHFGRIKNLSVRQWQADASDQGMIAGQSDTTAEESAAAQSDTSAEESAAAQSDTSAEESAAAQSDTSAEEGTDALNEDGAAGSVVIFTSMDERKWIYEAVYVGIYQPTDVEKMISGEYDLTLFTCTYGGKTRVTVGLDQVN